MGAVGPDFILRMLTRVHKEVIWWTNLWDIYYYEISGEDISRMDWPVIYTDPTPIQYVWDALGRKIVTGFPPLRTNERLRTALLEEQDRLIQGLINGLISSMNSLVTAA